MSDQIVVAVNGSAAMEFLKESSNLHFFSTSYFVLFHTEQSQATLALYTLSAWKVLSFFIVSIPKAHSQNWLPTEVFPSPND